MRGVLTIAVVLAVHAVAAPDARADATRDYAAKLKAIIEDPYCPDDRARFFFHDQYMRQLVDKAARINALSTTGVDRRLSTHAKAVAVFLDSYRTEYQRALRQMQANVIGGVLKGLARDDGIGAGLEAGVKTGNYVLQMKARMAAKALVLRTAWSGVRRGLNLSDIYWPSPPATQQDAQALVPFTISRSIAYKFSPAQKGPKGAEDITVPSSGKTFTGRVSQTTKMQYMRFKVTGYQRFAFSVTDKKPVFIVLAVDKDGDEKLDSPVSYFGPYSSGSRTTLLDPGTYYIRTISWRGNPPASVSYSFKLTPGERLRTLSRDPGEEAFKGAAPLAVSNRERSVTDSVGGKDPADYFKLAVRTTMDVTIDVKNERGSVYVYLQQDKNKDRKITNYESLGYSSRGLRKRLEKGVYYVKVVPRTSTFSRSSSKSTSLYTLKVKGELVRN